MTRKGFLAPAAVAVALVIAAVVITVSGLSSSRRLERDQHSDAGLGRGGLKGRVLDGEGQPLAGAQVTLNKVGSSVSVLLPVGTTDEHGEFSFSELMPGEYKVNASKEEDGYPNTRFELYSTGAEVVPQVTVYAGQVTSDVVVRFGPKAPKIVGKVVDAETGEPIENAVIVISRLGEPGSRLMTGPNKEDEKGGFALLVPPVPVIVEISAPGYEKKQINSLQLSRGEARHIDIPLRRGK
jgi:5-hydroxyisourate hydrolase-like protein (transthyretin family)